MKHLARVLGITLILTCLSAVEAHSQMQIASLKAGQTPLWHRTSPSVEKPDGPVLYQIVFRSSAAPNHIPKISTNHTLIDSLLTDNGSQVAIGGLAISSSGVMSFANGQPFPGTVSAVGAGDGSIAISGSSSAPTVSVAANGITNANIADGSLAPAKITGTAATLGANNFTGDQRVGSNILLKANGAVFALSGGFGGNSSGPALSANQFGQDRAIYGITFNNTNANPAVQGESHSSVGAGVTGINTDATAGHSGGIGVQGFTQSPAGVGVFGSGFSASGAAVGVEGFAGGPGIAGVFDNAGNGTILSGRVNGTEFFRADSTGFKSFMNGQTLVTGLVGCSTGFLGVAMSSSFLNCTNYALVSNGSETFLNVPTGGDMGFRINNNSQMTMDSNGNVHVFGTLSKGAGSFMIDDPIDPANKYLYHSFVESPDMMNIYNGIVMLDASGEAVVTLPDWFGALNRDFRYQLTAIGAPGPNLYVADEVSNNRFKIAGGTPGGKVSWQVTGIRQDAYANAHRIPVEVDKPDREKGTYLHPELFGAPPEKGIGALEGPTARPTKQ